MADPGATPLLRTVAVPVDDLVEWPGNPRTHAGAALDASVQRHGQYRSLLARELPDGRLQLLAGHGTKAALVRAGRDTVDVEVRDVPDDDAARAIVLADNRISDLASYDDALLLAQLDAASTSGGLDGTGWDGDAYRELVDQAMASGSGDGADGEGGDGDDAAPTKGELLELAGTTIGEPEFTAETGQVWTLGRHTLVVCDVHTQWDQWAPLLRDDMLFWPYPSMLALFARKAETVPVLMVQPNRYLAGWILTKWARITGATPSLTDPS